MEEKGKVLVANLVKKFGEGNRELINKCIYRQVRKNSKVIANLSVSLLLSRFACSSARWIH